LSRYIHGTEVVPFTVRAKDTTEDFPMMINCLAILAALSSPAPGDVALFAGQPGGVGDVQSVDENGASVAQDVPGLQGVTLQPIDFAGRAEITELLPDRPRWRRLVPGSSRLQLPQGVGSLYKFSRDDGASGVSFGFFLVDAGGTPRTVWEQTGTGPLLDVDPFIARVAVAPAGTAMLVATTLAAGGDLYEVDLITGTALSRSAGLAPDDFYGAGLALHDAWGIAVGANAILRFDRMQPGDAQAVAFAGTAPNWFARELILSPNGAHAATVAGSGPGLRDVWVFSMSGLATRVTQTPCRVSGAGYLPESRGGPYLSVSNDGLLCAWRTEGPSREIHLGRVHPQAGETPVFQLTANVNFTDTGTESSVPPPLAQTGFFMAWGEDAVAAENAIEGMDLFRVELLPGSQAPTFTNLSLTSGDAQAPFTVLGTIKPSRWHWVPQAGKFLLHNELSGGTGEVLVIDPTVPGAQVLLADVDFLDFVEPVGSDLLIAVQRAADPAPRELYRVPAALDGPPTLLMSQPENDEPLRWTIRPDGRAGILFPSPLDASETLFRVNAVNGTVLTFTNRLFRYGRTLDFAPGGALVFSVGIPNFPSTFVRWPFGGIVARLLPFKQTGFILPGP